MLKLGVKIDLDLVWIIRVIVRIINNSIPKLGYRNRRYENIRHWTKGLSFNAQPWRSQLSLRSTTRPLTRLWVEALDRELGQPTALEARACHWTCRGSNRTKSRAEQQWSHLHKSSNRLRKWLCLRKTTRPGSGPMSWASNINNSEVRNPLHLLEFSFNITCSSLNFLLWMEETASFSFLFFLMDLKCEFSQHLIYKVLSHPFLTQS